MTHPVDKTKLKWTLYAISFFHMGSFAVYPALSSISQAFPDASDFTLQLCSGAYGVAALVCALLADQVGKVLSRRNMILLGYSLIVLCGIGGFFLQFSVYTVLLWCAIAGFGVGTYVPACSALLMDCFTAEEQTEVAGRQNIFVNLGGIVLSLLGGYLSAWNWRGTFLGFLLGVPILILAFRYLPKTTPVADQRRCTTDATHFRDRIPPLVPMVYIMMVMLFIVVYMTFSTNFSLLLTDRFGADTTAWFSGLGSGLFMFSGMCAGFLFSKLTKVFHNGILVLACLVLCAGFVVLSLANNLALVVVGIFLSGASFSLIIPQTVVIVSARVNQAQSLVASSLLMGVSPNIGGILSPLVFTKLSILMGHNDITFRFQFAAVAAVALILLYLWVLHWSKRREARAAASSAQS